MSYNLADATRDQICDMLELDVPVTLSPEKQEKLLACVDQLSDMADAEAERIRCGLFTQRQAQVMYDLLVKIADKRGNVNYSQSDVQEDLSDAIDIAEQLLKQLEETK